MKLTIYFRIRFNKNRRLGASSRAWMRARCIQWVWRWVVFYATHCKQTSSWMRAALSVMKIKTIYRKIKCIRQYIIISTHIYNICCSYRPPWLSLIGKLGVKKEELFRVVDPLLEPGADCAGILYIGNPSVLAHSDAERL